MKHIFGKHQAFALVFLILTALVGCTNHSDENPSVSQTASVSTESDPSQAIESIVSSPQSNGSLPTEISSLSSSEISDLTSRINMEMYGDVKIGGNADKIILVGDSRVEIMALDPQYGNMEKNSDDLYCGKFGALSEDYVLAKGGAMFDWMDENISQIDEWIDDGTAIVIAMGVNGCNRLEDESLDEFADRYGGLYGNWIIEKSKEWKKKGAVTYFVSVNPVDDVCVESWGYDVRNAEIEVFNKRIRKMISDYEIGYIDTYSEVYDWVTKLHETDGVYQSGSYKGHTISDGLHYGQGSIIDKIWKIVKGKPPVAPVSESSSTQSSESSAASTFEP